MLGTSLRALAYSSPTLQAPISLPAVLFIPIFRLVSERFFRVFTTEPSLLLKVYLPVFNPVLSSLGCNFLSVLNIVPKGCCFTLRLTSLLIRHQVLKFSHLGSCLK